MNELERYKKKNLAMALYRFATDTVKLELDIGKLEAESSNSDDFKYKVVGNKYAKYSTYNEDEVSNILNSTNCMAISKVLSTNTDICVKSNCVFDMQFNVNDVMSEISTDEKYRSIINDAASIVRKINSYKYVLIPFSMDKRFNVINDRILNKRAPINSIEWKLEDSEIIMYLNIKSLESGKIIKRPISEYNKSIWLDNDIIGIALASEEISKSIIDIGNSGAIRTIHINTGIGFDIVIDNMYIYKVIGDDRYIAGYWDSNDICYIDSEVCSFIENNLVRTKRVVAMHRKYIIPYGLCKTNNVNV